MGSKRKIIIVSITFGVVAALLIIAVGIPSIMAVKKNLAELISIKKELALSNGGAKMSQQLRNRYKKIEANLDRIDKLFIDPQAPIDLIEFWEKTAADCGLSIAISPASLQAKKGDPWNSIGFQINLIGSFPDFSKFLEKTESSFYLIKAQSLVIDKLEKNKNKEKSPEIHPGDIKANLLVKVFTK
jgi:hypothetical protein